MNLFAETGFPESVIDLMSGNLGQPKGGYRKGVQKVILGDRKPMRGRPSLRSKSRSEKRGNENQKEVWR